MANDHEYTIEICWSSVLNQWRWQCRNDGCDGAWHPTACTDPESPGCASTAALNHADSVHPDENPGLVNLGECPDEAARL
jgi:hypothetical protein